MPRLTSQNHSTVGKAIGRPRGGKHEISDPIPVACPQPLLLRDGVAQPVLPTRFEPVTDGRKEKKKKRHGADRRGQRLGKVATECTGEDRTVDEDQRVQRQRESVATPHLRPHEDQAGVERKEDLCDADSLSDREDPAR